MLHGETIHSCLPQDIPWWDSGHAVFFGVLYIVLIVVCVGLGYCTLKSWFDSRGDSHVGGHQQ